jgi:hypothetical protein
MQQAQAQVLPFHAPIFKFSMAFERRSGAVVIRLWLAGT